MMVHQAILTYYLKTRASPIFTFSIQHITELPTSIQYVTYCCRNRLLNVPLDITWWCKFQSVFLFCDTTFCKFLYLRTNQVVSSTSSNNNNQRDNQSVTNMFQPFTSSRRYNPSTYFQKLILQVYSKLFFRKIMIRNSYLCF